MPLEESLLLVNVILSIIAVAVAVYLIPRMHTELVRGWNLMVIGLVLFVGIQLLRMTGINGILLTALNTLFITIFIIGLFIHFTTIVKHSQVERRKSK